MALLPWSCNQKPRAPLPPIPPPQLPKVTTRAPVPIPAPIPSTIPTTPAPPTLFDVAEIYFEAGDYARAAEAYEYYLRDHSPRDNEDRALFRLALTRYLPGSPVRDPAQASNLLQQIIKQFPDSSLRPQAELLLNLQTEIDRLRTDVGRRDDRIRDLSRELERLKQIDLRRRPAL